MELLPSTVFASVVAGAEDSLKKIAELIEKYCGGEAAKEFIQAYRGNNFTESNRLLDKTVVAITGHDSVSGALSIFADKFPQLNPSLSNELSLAMSEKDKVIALSHHADAIMRIIEGRD